MDLMAKQRRVRVLRTACMLFSMLAWPGSAMAQQRERTLDEIKTEAIKRAENGMYPLIGLDPADVREAFAAIKTPDYEEWAAAFSTVADRYMTQAKALEATDAEVPRAHRQGLIVDLGEQCTAAQRIGREPVFDHAGHRLAGGSSQGQKGDHARRRAHATRPLRRVTTGRR